MILINIFSAHIEKDLDSFPDSGFNLKTITIKLDGMDFINLR